MLSGAREAGCFREVAALHSDHLRQVPLYIIMIYMYKGRSGLYLEVNYTVLLCELSDTLTCSAGLWESYKQFCN